MEITMNEKFDGSIEVEYEDMPSIMLESYKSLEITSTPGRLAAATRRRRFTLRENWDVELRDVDFSGKLNGTVRIPARRDEENRSIVFDGASIPFPWLVSVLTIGVLRPLGVMLVGSIVHDYAYKYGSLLISKDGDEFEEVRLSRDEADTLFRNIVGTVNKLPIVGYVAWYAVRIGWLWVRYEGKFFGGRAPVVEYVILAIAILFVFQAARLCGSAVLGTFGMTIYGLLYLASIIMNRINQPAEAQATVPQTRQ